MRASILFFLSYFIFSFLPGLRASLIFFKISIHLFILFFGCGGWGWGEASLWPKDFLWLQGVGLLFVAIHGLLIAMASLWSTGSKVCRLQ